MESSHKIFYDSEKFDETIKSLKDNMTNLGTIRTTFSTSTSAMEEEWDGTGADVYESACRIIQSKLGETIKNLNEEITYLQDSIDAILQVDNVK